MVIELKSEFWGNVRIPPISDFMLYQEMLKEVARFQMQLDRKFAEKVLDLKSKLLKREISATAFWNGYKKILLESVGKDKKLIGELVKKMDKKMKERCVEAEKEEKKNKGKPPIDLSLPS
ncbi:MAG: hypothetical protein V1676_00020 [Candidatus Diapherotrites archaeon]